MLNRLPCDVFLPAHASMRGDFLEKAAAARRGAAPNPFVDPALGAFVRNSQQAFETTLIAQQKTAARR